MISRQGFTENILTRSDVLWHEIADDEYRYGQSKKGRLGYILTAIGSLAYATFKYRVIAGPDLRISKAELASLSWLSWGLYIFLALLIVFSIISVIASLFAVSGKPVHWGSKFNEYVITQDALYLIGADDKHNLIIHPKDVVKVEVEGAETKNFLFIELSIHYEAKTFRSLSSEIRLDGVKDFTKAKDLLLQYFVNVGRE